jgi:arabinofuranan 3-O-arabinosyltransferase
MALLRDRRVWLLLAWVVCLFNVADRFHYACHAADNAASLPMDRHRPDGNFGHATIDFGGSWVLGRMIVEGRGRSLYDRNELWRVVRAAYPRSASPAWVQRESFPKSPTVVLFGDDDPRHDDDWLMYWMMGRDSPAWDECAAKIVRGMSINQWDNITLRSISSLDTEAVRSVNAKSVGGPLYPPVAAMYYAPLTFGNDPQISYRVFQVLLLVAAFAAGWGIRQLSRGLIWWPWATTAVLLFPGFRSGIGLGQNAAITLLLLVLGWALQHRGRAVLGGMVWGFLAFKPSWAVAFLLLPLLTKQWKFAAAMIGTAAALCLATLPIVGLESWFDWLAVGREASATYASNMNWVGLSRDLGGLIRRLDPADRFTLSPVLYLVTFGMTILVRQRPALLALGCYLLCYRFMYYDALLALFPLTLLLAEHKSWRTAAESWPGYILLMLIVWENQIVLRRWEYTFANGQTLGVGERYAWDTGLLLMLFVILAVQQLVQGRARVRLPDE